MIFPIFFRTTGSTVHVLINQTKDCKFNDVIKVTIYSRDLISWNLTLRRDDVIRSTQTIHTMQGHGQGQIVEAGNDVSKR